MKNKEAEELLIRLGVVNFTKRHIGIINDFIESEDIDSEELLTQLGGWDENDLKITKKWLDERLK